MSQSILLRGARQLLTLRGTPGVRRGSDFGKLEIIEDGSVFIKDGKIASVGSTRRLENLKEVSGALTIPVQNCIVMPGFVDPYLQLSLAVPDASGVLKRRKTSDFHSESITLLRSCLQHGTLNACVKATSGFSSLNGDMSVLRQLTRIRNSPIGLKRVWCASAGSADHPAADKLIETLQSICKRKLADAIELRNDAGLSLSNPLLNAAQKTDLTLSLDWAGSAPQESKEFLDKVAPVSVFCRHNLSPGERAVLAAAKSIAVFKAGGTLLDGPPAGSLRDLAEAGGAIAIGSGYDAGHEPNYNMQLVLAVAVMRLYLTIEQAIVATTINAAYAMNCGNEIGSLEPGKRADVLVLTLSDYREIPRRLGVNHVAMAIREGVLAINRTRWRVGVA